MKELPQKEYKKIAVVVLVLLVLLSAIAFLRLRSNKTPGGQKQSVNVAYQIATPTPSGLIGSYSVVFEDKKPKVGQPISAIVSFSAKGKRIVGTDVILHFDPAFLVPDKKLKLLDFFTRYPRQEVDLVKGTIKVTGFQAKNDQPLTTPNVLFIATFQVKKTGATRLWFDFVPGKTNLTTLVEKGTSKNILGIVKDAAITIEQ